MENNAQTIENSSILDKVLKSKKSVSFILNPKEIIHQLINQNLDDREQSILCQRYGLGCKKTTLEKIGKNLDITRERVRQIVKQALEKISQEKNNQKIRLLDIHLKDIFEKNGGLIEEQSLVQKFFENETDDKKDYLIFFLDNLSELITQAPLPKTSWQLIGAPIELQIELEKLVLNFLEYQNMPQETSAIYEHLLNNEEFNNWQNKFRETWPKHDETNWQNILRAYLELSSVLAVNPFDEWGHISSPLVRPRRMADKIYLVLKNSNKPIHFEEITRLINEFQFDLRSAYSPTIHNELILDDRFVLVGRGTYALKEWGYQPGTVADVLERILLNSGRVLSRDELIAAVLKERVVKKGTILLALTNRDKFKRLEDGRYILIKNSK